MPDLFEKGAREGEMEIEAIKKLYEALFKGLLDVGEGIYSGLQPGLEIEKKKRGVAKDPQFQEQETVSVGSPIVESTEKQKKERQQQAVDDDLTIKQTKKPEKEQQSEPYGRIFGPGVNALTPSDIKTLAAIMSAKRGAIIADSDYDYVVKYNGKVLFETTMGEITTHKRIPPELYDKIAALSPDPKIFDKMRDKVTDAADWLKSSTADRGRSDIDFSLPIVDLIDTPFDDLINNPKLIGRHSFAEPKNVEISNAINPPVTGKPESQLPSNDLPEEDADYNPGDFFDDIEIEAKVIPETEPEPVSKSPQIDRLVNKIQGRANADIAVVKDGASQAKGIIDHYMGMIRGIPAGNIPSHSESFEAVKGMFEEIAQDEENEFNQGLTSPVVEAPPDPNLDQVSALFKVFQLNAGVEQTIEKGKEGTITFPAGEQLVNKIEDRQMFLSLLKDGTAWELGSYDQNTKDVKVGADIAAAQASLNQISQQLDEKWLIKEPSINLAKPEKPAPDLNNFYNLEAQENLIGKILSEPAALQRSIDAGISEKSFTPGLHRDIFVAATAITDEGKQANVETIATVMDSTLASIRTDLATILARNSPNTSVDSIAEVIRQKQIRRDMDRMAANLRKSALDKTQPVFQTFRSNQNHATSIANGSYAVQQPPSSKHNATADQLKNIGSERLIIAAILKNSHSMKDLAASGLTSKAFTDPDHQEIFKAAETLYEKGLGSNLVSICNHVGDRASDRASEIANNVTPQSVKEPIANVMGLAQRRDSIGIADRLAAAAAMPGTSKAELLEGLGKAKEDLKSVSERSPKLPEVEVTTTVETNIEKSNTMSRGR